MAHTQSFRIKRHFVRRMQTRYDITIDRAMVARLSEEVESGQHSKFSPCKKDPNRSHVVVKFQGMPIPSVYDHKKKLLVTCYPPEALYTNEKYSFIRNCH